MQSYKVVEFSVKADGTVGTQVYKSGMPAHKAEALASKLNTAQDHEQGDTLLSYKAEKQ